MLELFPEGFEELARRRRARARRLHERGRRGADLAGVRRRGGDRRGGRLAGPLARVPQAGARRGALDRPAVGGAGRRRDRGRDRPGRAFGTGAHPTTQLCLVLLEDGTAGACSTSAAARACSRSRRRSSASARCAPSTSTRRRSRRRAERRRERRRRRRRPGRPARGRAPRGRPRAREHRRQAVVALGRGSALPRAITSGYLVSDEPELDGYRRRAPRPAGGWAADLHVRK